VTDRLVQDIQSRGNLGYSVAGLFARRGRSRSPLAIASFIAIPLFFASLMSSTLALEKPRLAQWTSGGKLQTTYHDPTTGTEARVWLWALLPAALLIVVGYVATRLPYGFYIACLAAIVDAMAVVHKTAVWERHHTHRFPNGVDLIAANNPASNKFDPGQWEKEARDTALSLQHWTISLALICMAFVAGITLKRRFFGRRPAPTYAAIETVGGAPSITMPEISES
jgi:hypothetical protein